MSSKLKKDWSGIGTILSWNWHIGTGLAYQSRTDIWSTFWCCVGIDMDWQWIGIGLTPDSHQIELNWHLIGNGFLLNWNWIVIKLDAFARFVILAPPYGHGISMGWSLIDIWFSLDLHRIGTDWLKLGTCLTLDCDWVGLDWHWIGNRLESGWRLIGAVLALDRICIRLGWIDTGSAPCWDRIEIIFEWIGAWLALRLALDWHWISDWLTSDWAGLALHRYWIDIGLASEWNEIEMGAPDEHQIGAEFVLDRSRIDIGLASDWDKIGMDSHPIGAGFWLDWNGSVKDLGVASNEIVLRWD